MQIIKNDNFVQLNKYYSLYSNMDRRQLENAIIRNMILRNKSFDSIHNKILEDLYNRLMKMKKMIVEEDVKLRENMINKLCEVNIDNDIENILKGIEPFGQK